MATFVVGGLLGAVGVSRSTDSPKSSPEAPALQAAPPDSNKAPNDLCSADSEGHVAEGWGPDRPTFHDDTFPNSLTFNSTSDNVNLGDERNFVAVKPDSNKQAGGWLDSVEAQNNQVYLIRVYARLDGPQAHEAKGTNLSVNLPTCTAHRVGVSATLSSLDAFPGQVWDGASFWSRRDFNLALVPDSGRLYSNAHPTPGLAFSVNDLVTSKGILLGSKALDGIFEPGYEHDVYVTFLVRAQVSE